jgi:hypothetical protein
MIGTEQCSGGLIAACLEEGKVMDALNREILTGEAVTATPAIEERMGASVASGMSLKPKPDAEIGAELTIDSIEPLIQKIGATSIMEIERLIGELQAARNYLRSEGERIQRETARFAQLNQTASASVKIISENIGEWRKAGHPVRSQLAG